MKVKVTARNYESEVLRSKKPVLVEFFAAWCGKCAMMEDVLEEFAEEHPYVWKVCQIEIDECSELAAKFEVEVVPTFVVFKAGKPIAAASGVLDKETLAEMMESTD